MERKSRGSYDDKKWVNPKCCLRGAFATNFKGAVVPSSSITLRTSHNDTPPFREDVIICKRVTLLPAPRLGPFVLHSRYTSTGGAPNKALSHSAVLPRWCLFPQGRECWRICVSSSLDDGGCYPQPPCIWLAIEGRFLDLKTLSIVRWQVAYPSPIIHTST